MRIHINKIFYTLFFLFSAFYLTTASIFTTSFSEMLRWVGSALLLVSALVYRHWRGEGIVLLPQIYLRLFIAVIPTMIRIGDMSIYAYARMVSYLLLIYSMYIFFSMNSFSRSSIEICMKIFAVIVGCFMIYSVVMYFRTGLDVSGRFLGVYDNANMLASISSFSLASSLWLCIVEERKKVLYYVMFVCSAGAALLSGSRAGVICSALVILAIPFIVITGKTIKEQVKRLGLIGGALCTIYVVANYFDLSALSRLLSYGSDSVGITRADAWNDVASIWADKPVFGWGYGAVGYKVFIQNDTLYNWGVHSSYFVMLIEMGIFGSILAALFFTLYFLQNYNLFKRQALSSKQIVFTKILLLMCIVMLVDAYAESFLFSVGNPMSLCFWLPFVMAERYLRCNV